MANERVFLFSTYYMLKKKSSHQVEEQESVDKTAKQFFPPKQFFPQNLTPRVRQLKNNVESDWSNQIITKLYSAYL